MHLFSSLLASLALVQCALGHGSLKAIEVSGKQYLAWQINQDPYVKPPPVRYARKVLNEGAVKDFTGKGITYVKFHSYNRRERNKADDLV
jgi:cellulase